MPSMTPPIPICGGLSRTYVPKLQLSRLQCRSQRLTAWRRRRVVRDSHITGNGIASARDICEVVLDFYFGFEHDVLHKGGAE